MAGLIPDERCFVLASFIFFLLMKMEQAISRTSAATYKLMKLKLRLENPTTLNLHLLKVAMFVFNAFSCLLINK